MTDREKVINGLEEVKHLIRCENLPAHTLKAILTVDDAIDLLKAQEPIAPVKVNRYMETDENGDWFSHETYDCGNCGVELHGKANYCHLCGRAVKW